MVSPVLKVPPFRVKEEELLILSFAPNANIPDETVIVPVYELEPVITIVPSPVLFKPLLEPEMLPPIDKSVAALPLATLNVIFDPPNVIALEMETPLALLVDAVMLTFPLLFMDNALPDSELPASIVSVPLTVVLFVSVFALPPIKVRLLACVSPFPVACPVLLL